MTFTTRREYSNSAFISQFRTIRTSQSLNSHQDVLLFLVSAPKCERLGSYCSHLYNKENASVRKIYGFSWMHQKMKSQGKMPPSQLERTAWLDAEAAAAMH